LSSEIEIKLDLSPEALGALDASGLLGEPIKTVNQHATYYDTRDQQLRSEGYSLRIRQAGGTRIQTVKATGASRSLFSR